MDVGSRIEDVGCSVETTAYNMQLCAGVWNGNGNSDGDRDGDGDGALSGVTLSYNFVRLACIVILVIS